MHEKPGSVGKTLLMAIAMFYSVYLDWSVSLSNRDLAMSRIQQWILRTTPVFHIIVCKVRVFEVTFEQHVFCKTSYTLDHKKPAPSQKLANSSSGTLEKRLHDCYVIGFADPNCGRPTWFWPCIPRIFLMYGLFYINLCFQWCREQFDISHRVGELD